MKGKAKSKFDFNKGSCKYQNSSWCKLPKFKRCEHCIRLVDGTKACQVMI